MNTLTTIKTHIKSILTNIKEKRQYAKMSKAIQEASDKVQIREYNNEIYICINNVPVVTQDQTNQPLTTILNQIRQNIAAYIYNKKF